MASQLVNLMRVLSWNDYPRQSSPAPGPNETKFGALTATMIKPSGWGVEPIPGTKLSRLRDSVTVTVEFVKEQSWVEDWVFTKPQAFQDDLLTHEQGHYKLAALLARDAFLAFMQLKSKQYAHSQDLQKDLNQITSNILSKAGALDKKYEDETRNGTVANKQAQWNGFIQTAFTTPANPPQTTPDGTAVKIPILTVLAQSGVNL